MTVTGKDSGSTLITHQISDAATNYPSDGSISISSVSVTVTAAAAGLAITETDDETTVSEDGTTVTDTYTVVLNTEPTHEVRVTSTSGDTAAARVNPGTLTFSTIDWGTAQTVTVTGVDDSTDNPGGGREVSISHVSSSTDSSYRITNGGSVTARVTDDDATTVTLAGASGNIREGQTKEFTIEVGRGLVDGEVLTVPLTFGGDATRGTDYTMTGAAADGVQYNNLNSGNANVVFNGPESGATATGARITLSATEDSTAENTPESVEIDLGDITDTGLTGAGGVSETDNLSPFTISDATPPGLAFSKATLTVSEDGTTVTDTYTVLLKTEPTHDVTVTVTAGGGAQVNITGGSVGSEQSLTFTPSNWGTAQTITVTGVNDDIDNVGDARTVTIAHAASSDDTRYDIDDAGSVSVTVSDDDEAGLTITETAGSTTVSEDGTTLMDTYTIALTSEPTHDVTVTVTAGGGAQVNITGGSVGSEQSLTFTPSGANIWSTAQTVTVTGVDDELDNVGDARTVTIAHAVSSDDTRYDIEDAGSVSVTVSDDDEAGVTISASSLSVTELGDSSSIEKSYTVELDTNPGMDVTITVNNGDNSLRDSRPIVVDTDSGTDGNQTTLTFTSGNWDTPQTVTVRALNDRDDANESVSLTHSAVVSDTSNPYHGISIDPVMVSTTDAGHGVVVSEGMVSVNENDEEATYTVVLKSRPGGRVNIEVESDSPDRATVLPATLRFGNTDWDMVQTVTVTGKGEGSALISHKVSRSRFTTSYPIETTIAPVSVKVSAGGGLVISETEGETTVGEDGRTTDSYTIALRTEPSHDVTVRVSAGSGVKVNTSGGTASSEQTLTFTPSGSGIWSMAQTITVTGEDDDIDNEGDARTVRIRHSASSDDARYAIEDGGSVEVTVIDDDTVISAPSVLIANMKEEEGSTTTEIADRAQAFTTGDNATGYVVTGVDLRLVRKRSSSGVASVGIWSSDEEKAPRKDSDSVDDPHRLVGALSCPPLSSNRSLDVYKCTTEGIILDAETTYVYVFDIRSPTGSELEIKSTRSGSEDPGGASGWSNYG